MGGGWQDGEGGGEEGGSGEGGGVGAGTDRPSQHYVGKPSHVAAKALQSISDVLLSFRLI